MKSVFSLPWIEHNIRAVRSKNITVEDSDIESDAYCEQEDSEDDEEDIDLGQYQQCPAQEDFVPCVDVNGSNWIPGTISLLISFRNTIVLYC